MSAPVSSVVSPPRALPRVAAFALAIVVGIAFVRLALAADTAESVFRRLPPGIFENTPEPIGEEAKEHLLDRGYISNWVVVRKDVDELIMAATGAMTAEVRVRLFRVIAAPSTISGTTSGGRAEDKDGDMDRKRDEKASAVRGVAVLGARSGDACAAELWRYDAHGGLVPTEGPAEPSLSDFFRPGYTLPPGINPTYRLCLTGERLEADPLFWNESGLVEFSVEKRVFFAWNGTAFNKQTERATP